jgi:hypothetical protein
MDDWRKSLKRAFGETIGPAQVGMEDLLSASRQISKFNRLSQHLQGLDAMAAAKKGVGPAELAALRGLRVSEISPKRLNELCETLLHEK